MLSMFCGISSFSRCEQQWKECVSATTHERVGAHERKDETLREAKLERRWRLKAADETKMKKGKFAQQAIRTVRSSALPILRLWVTAAAMFLTVGARHVFTRRLPPHG